MSINLVNTRKVNNECIRDDKVYCIFTSATSSLTHTLTQGLPSAKLTFVTINRVVLFNFNPEGGVTKSDAIPNRRSIHRCVCLAPNDIFMFADRWIRRGMDL